MCAITAYQRLNDQRLEKKNRRRAKSKMTRMLTRNIIFFSWPYMSNVNKLQCNFVRMVLLMIPTPIKIETEPFSKGF